MSSRMFSASDTFFSKRGAVAELASTQTTSTSKRTVSPATTGPSRGDGGSGLGGGHGSVATRRQAAADSSTASRMKSPDREDADRPENTLPVQVILPTAGLAAAAAASGPAMVRNASTSEALVVEDEEEEEEESEEVQNLWQSIFTFFPMIWSAITMCAAELIEMGLLQYLALLVIPIWWGIQWLMDAFTDQPVLPNAPPPPPMQPPFYVRAQDATWDYAERHPVYYLMSLFGAFFSCATFVLFLKDITDWMERTTAERRMALREKERRQGGGSYARLEEADGAEPEKRPVTASDMVNELRVVMAECEMKELRVQLLPKSAT
eukprot:jgi/Chrpa1/13758/Chrysochromulina_OHIO_Genome00010356-RA